MRGFRPWMGVAVGGGLFALFTHCTPEELLYQSSIKDASVEGKAGDGSIGVGGKPGWAEICGNGLDDDLDGKTDCEDPNCENYACVTLPPSGWQGPVAVFQGAAGGLPSCPKGLTEVYAGHTALSFEPSDCTAGCSCGSPTSTSCSGSLAYHGVSSCGSTVASYSLSSGMGCGTGYAGIVASVQVSTTASGSCGAGTPPTAQKGSVTWTTDVRACALETDAGKQAGCETGKVCAPATSEALACVFQPGDLDCPSGYDTRYVSYNSYADTRDCGSCSCTFASDGCSIPVNLFQTSDCSIQLTSISNGCYNGDVHAATTGSASVQNPRCDSGTSSPSGCVVPDQPTTLCCAGGTGSPCPSGGGPKMVQVTALDGSTYCVDSTEVTKTDYAAFLAASPAVAGQSASCIWNTSYTPTADWPAATGEENEPVAYVDWCDAVAFCTWAGKRLCGKIGGGALTLSTANSADVSQWDNACSKGGSLQYPYGTSFVSGACNGGATLADVKEHPCCQGGFSGLYDLVGNVSEWEDACDSQNPKPENHQCTSRGGSTCDAVSNRSRKDKVATLGFRCCGP